MESFQLKHDIKVLCVRADHFPEGIKTSHEKLHALLPDIKERTFWGLSAPDRTGKIIYKAAAEVLMEGEANTLQLETAVIKKGIYSCITLMDFPKNPTSISEAFQKLIHLPGIDPQGECVEWYLNDKEVRCMVRMAQ